MNPLRLLRNRNVLFTLAFILGLLFGDAAEVAKPVITPALALVVLVSTIRLPTSLFRNPSALVVPMALAVALNFGLQSGVVLVLAQVVAADSNLWVGFVLLASVPTAVAVFPFARILNGDDTLALIGTLGTYLAALIITPLMTLTLVGESLIHPVDLLIVLGGVIIVPLILSRLIRATGTTQILEPWTSTIVNWSFFIVIFIAAGSNREVFLSQFDVLAIAFGIGVASTFVLGAVIEVVAKLLRVDSGKTVSLVLLGTLKNYGIAIAIALTLSDNRAAIPATVMNAVAVLYFIYLGIRAERARRPSGKP